MVFMGVTCTSSERGQKTLKALEVLKKPERSEQKYLDMQFEIMDTCKVSV